MKYQHLVILTTLLLTALGLPAAAVDVTPYSYTEDFTTNDYRDPLVTTADWDTAAGSLHLPPFVTSLVGTWDSPGLPNGLDVDGDYAYLADDTYGLQIVDISDPENPVGLGSYNTPGVAYDVDVEGIYAYVADGAAGLRAVNISNPAAPTAGGYYNTPGTAYAVDVDGDYAYVADGTGGLRVVRVVNPLSLYSVGTVATTSYAFDVDVEGDLVYMVAYEEGLVIIDVSNPASPSVVGGFNTPGYAYGVAVDGNYAYVADGATGLIVVHVGEPTGPIPVAVLDTPDLAMDVKVDGDWAYVADRSGGVHAVDIHDPTSPALYQTCNPPANARAVALAGAHAYVADHTAGLQALEICKSAAPVPFTPLDTSYPLRQIVLAGDFAFMPHVYDGLLVIGIGDPTSPYVAGTFDTDYAFGVDVAGNYAYVADHDYGLIVIDITDPTFLFQAGDYATATNCYGVTVEGNFAYVANQAAGLLVLDISDPTNPAFMSSLATPDWLWDVDIDGDRAYLAQYGAGIAVVDVSNPGVPVLLGTCDPLGDFQSVRVAGDYAYAAGGSAGMRVIDIRDPYNPTVVATVNEFYSSRQIVVAGDRAYVSFGGAGLQVVDISDPLQPTVIAVYDPGSDSVGGLAVAGDYAFLGWSTSGFQPVQVRTRAVDVDGNVAKSLEFSAVGNEVLKVKATAVQSGTIDWEVRTLDPGVPPWQPIVPDGAWNDLAVPGELLVWQCTLDPDLLDLPVCTDLEISWLCAPAIIASISDIPDDQGGRVRVRFVRSAYDFDGETTPITGYNVWRRVDDPAKLKALGGVAAVPADGPVFGDLALREFDGHLFTAPIPAGKSSQMPPGVWEVMGSFWAMQQEEYVFPAATLADSSETVPWAVYCVTAHTATPSLWYASMPDSGYSVDNIAPTAPLNLRQVGTMLLWEPAPEPDFDYYTIYGSAQPVLDESAVQLGYAVAPEYDVAANSYDYYLVTVSDAAHNEGEAASVSSLIAVEDTPALRTALLGNIPNPFNPATVIRYELAEPSRVDLRVYDVGGRLVRILIAGDEQVAGLHDAIWDGRDEAGGMAAAGVYFSLLKVDAFNATRAMVLIK